MKTNFTFLAIAMIVVSLIFFACDDAGQGDEADGTIYITNLSPSNDLVDATLTDFTVNISYTLTGTDQGELDIGFNNYDVIDSYLMISDAEVIVNQGSGSYIFNVSTVTKDWGSSGDFSVYVHISEYPHKSTWRPLDFDTHILTFK